jgi:hypothetical protein
MHGKLRTYRNVERLLLFGLEYFVFPFVVLEYKNHTLRKYSVAFCFCVCGTWFSYKGKDTEEDIWT